MAYEFKFPDVGEGIQEGEIVKWRVKVGDVVREDQPLVEMETAKAIVEIPSPKAGKILAAFGKEGDTVKVGAVLVTIEEKEGSKSGPGVIGHIPTESNVVLPPRGSVTLRPPKGDTVMVREPHHDAGPVERVPLHGVRKAIADHMVKSKSTIPHVTHMDEFDMTNLIKLRESKKADAEKQGIKLTFLAFITKTVVETFKKHPAFNAELAGNEIIYKKYYNIGIAVDTPEGLMVPIIKDADKKDVLQIAKEIAEDAVSCRDRTIKPEQLAGGTFTITNIGSIGGTYATPVITYGQSAILGVMKMKDKPVAINGKVEIRPIITLCLAFDHRVTDGAEAARFMNDLIATLENSIF
jgi:pyruvate dehydrogenase E2 component (dihydrolipoamide acetyltransferase)